MENSKPFASRLTGRILIVIAVVSTVISMYFFARLLIDSFTFR
ncbi:MAG TPA: hypothetical protein VK004_06880 [Ignavibacteria bacterium]|nr:hypothetical protein [Ignavibacteria bacterium]